MSLPCCPLYCGLRGTGPSGLCEVTAHTTCSDRLSPRLVCSLSGHAWRGRCIDLVAQTPSDTRERNTDTHITSNGTRSAHLHSHSRSLFFNRFLCNFVFNETYCMCFTNLGRQLLPACSGGLNRLYRTKKLDWG